MSREGQKTEFAKQLRRNQTDAEALFWAKVRNRRLGGFKFKRQATIGPYIADFYCAEKKLIIELDGGQHAERQNYDEKRTKYFESLGLQVMRYWNHEIHNDLDWKLDGLLRKIEIW